MDELKKQDNEATYNVQLSPDEQEIVQQKPTNTERPNNLELGQEQGQQQEQEVKIKKPRSKKQKEVLKRATRKRTSYKLLNEELRSEMRRKEEEMFQLRKIADDYHKQQEELKKMRQTLEMVREEHERKKMEKVYRDAENVVKKYKPKVSRGRFRI